MTSPLRTTLATATTLCSGFVGGGLFQLLHLPMPWLLGAILGTSISSIAGLPTGIPSILRNAVMVVVGLMIGSTVHPDTLAHIAKWPFSMTAVLLYVMLVTGSLYFFLKRFAGFDPITAYFAAAPGGLLPMIMIGSALGGRERNITITHSVRVVLVIFTVVLNYHLLVGVGTTPAAVIATASLTLRQGLELSIIGLVGWLFGHLLHLPVAPLLGSLLLLAILQVLGLPAVHVPPWPLLTAEWVIGSSIGAGFAGVKLRELAQTLFMSVAATCWMLTLSLVFSMALVPLTKLPLATLFLALCPGGLSGVALIALAQGCNPAFVTAHSLLRMLLILFAAPIVFRFIHRHKTSRLEQLKS